MTINLHCVVKYLSTVGAMITPKAGKCCGKPVVSRVTISCPNDLCGRDDVGCNSSFPVDELIVSFVDVNAKEHMLAMSKQWLLIQSGNK